MAGDITMVHVTHEAVGKVGGIGTVLNGFFTCKAYLDAVGRSILVAPLFITEGTVLDRLGEDGEVLYSSLDGFVRSGYEPAFRKIESYYNVGIIYGHRTFVDKHTGIKSSQEVLLIDVRHLEQGIINQFKKQLYEQFGIRSDLYEHLWEYEQYVRLAPAAIATLKAIGAVTDSTVIVSHEYMGMPTALAAILEPDSGLKTAFYAHEVATMRNIVEKHPGHDTMFYNVIRQAHKNKLYVSDVFGNQSFYFKHPLVAASKYCDTILAVGSQIADELRFLSPEFENADINIVYNGIPAHRIGVAEKLASKEKLRTYCENLLGYRPDLVFTHVTRLVQSKGLWRDLRVLEHIEGQLRAQGRTAVMFLLSTEVAQRHSCDVYEMEAKYCWPVAHREGWPDMSGGEAAFYAAIQEFNAISRNIKIVFINQFGFERKCCGLRMPEDMEFMDIRRGGDVEFGQSIYEPFGIAQLEPLTFGGICVVSSVCGCSGFVRDAVGDDTESVKNVILADYTNLNSNVHFEINDLLHIDRPVRDEIEAKESRRVAAEIMKRLPKNEQELDCLIQSGYRTARNMSWDVVVEHYLLPGLGKILHKEKPRQLAAKVVA
jgi:hypothetical protein